MLVEVLVDSEFALVPRIIAKESGVVRPYTTLRIGLSYPLSHESDPTTAARGSKHLS
jgi:hypothetical protein